MVKSHLFKIVFLLLLFNNTLKINAQVYAPKQAFELSTKQIYDLMIDSHGFLWIASDLGVSRYDGISIVNFTNTLQSSVACTGLLEDIHGRIWFNNFTGQIYYIENESMHLLKSYNYKEESSFPRIALYKDQLVATSDSGLFVLNTNTLIGKYVKCSNALFTSTNSLTVLSDCIIAGYDNIWYKYKPNGSLKKIPFIGNNKTIAGDVLTLHSLSVKDTIYQMSNPSGFVKKLVIQNDSVKLCQSLHFNSFINTISSDKGSLWVNTRESSYLMPDRQQIQGLNISDIVIDREGNQWLSSLTHGLMVRYRQDITNKIQIPELNSSDIVISLNHFKSKLLLGTQNGFLIAYNALLNTTDWIIKFPKNPGSINNITAINDHEFLIGCSIATYRVDIVTKKVTEIPDIKSVKQVYKSEQLLYVATAGGVFAIPENSTDSLRQIIVKRFGSALKYEKNKNYFSIRQRSRAVAYFPESQSLLIASKNGLYQVNKKGILPVYFHGNQVYAAALLYAGHKVFIGTINNGLLILEKSGIKQISINEGLFSTTIFKLKGIGQHMWIIGSGPLQLFDLQTLKPITNYELVSRNQAQVFDVEEINKKVYLSTLDGLFNFRLRERKVKNKPENYLLSVKINNQISAYKNNATLTYSKNNILFKIGVPSYKDAHSIYIKYCLVTETDSTWQVTEPGERTVNFSSLMPGKYRFKAIAVDPRLGVANKMIIYDFNVIQPWWRRTWFKGLFIILILLMVSYIYINESFKKMAFRKAFFEQEQSIKAERQRISSEIHDDVGAGIFAIYLFADLASKNKENEELSKIKLMIHDLSDKIKEIIWTTNIENDNLENLLYFIQFQITKQFEHTNIDVRSAIPDDIINANISSLARRNIYLIVKELAHNALKHSKATLVNFEVIINENFLVFVIKDNGVGFDSSKPKPNSMGLKNIRSRIERLDGNLMIENTNGTAITVNIPLAEILTFNYNKKKRRWSFLTWED